MTHKEICAMLGIPETTPEAEARVALQNHINTSKNNSAELERLRGIEASNKQESVKLLLDKAEADKKFLPTQRAHYEKLAKADFTGTKELIDSITPVVNLAATTTDPAAIAAAAGREAWDFNKWRKEDSKGLQLMQENEPAKFKALYDKTFNKA